MKIDHGEHYCPYTDETLSSTEMNSEHIIPLSLGGANGFEIPVCKKFNAKAGSAIDAVIGKQLIIQSRRTKLKVKGQSGKVAEMYYKKAFDGDTGLPLQVKITKDKGINVRAPYIPDNFEMVTTRTIKLPVKIDREIWLKYVAKVALSSGYFAYGKLFKEKVNTKNLRLIMNKSNDELIEKYCDMKVNAHDLFMEEASINEKLCKHVCKAIGENSCVGIIPDKESITIFAGILGQYVGSIRVEADTMGFPNEGDFYWGHFMCVQGGKLKRGSHRKLLEKIVS